MPDYPIFDGHNDTLLRFYNNKDLSPKDFFTELDGGHIDYRRSQKGGFAGGFFAVFIPNKTMNVKPGKAPKPKRPDPLKYGYSLKIAMSMVSILFQIEAESEGKFKIVRTADELQTCINKGIFAAILHFEGAEAVDEDLESLDVFYQAGLRSLGIVWSRKTIFGDGVPFKFPSSPDIGKGLTKKGKRLVKRCNELGIMIDLSHMNEKGFWDVAKLSDAPLVATHSNVHTLCATPRNLTDKQLDAIKESDGMVGLNFATGFLREDGKWESDTPLETMVKHIDYLVERVGETRVGFGSDYDGAGVPEGVSDVSKLPNLIKALKDAGYGDDLLKKITHENWIRVLRKTWGS